MAVLYASAYGNTAALAQAISRGVTKAGAVKGLLWSELVFENAHPSCIFAHQRHCTGAQSSGEFLPFLH